MTSKLRVLVDATSMPPDLGGVGRYLEQLVPALARRDDLELIVAAQSRDAERFRQAAPSATVVTPVRGGRLRRMIWEQFGLPTLARQERVEVIHAPHYEMPVFTRIAVAVTVHDATFFSHPEVHTRLKRAFFRAWTRWSARHAGVVIVPSHATADELKRHTRTTAPVDVAHHGVDLERFHPPTAEEVESVARALGTPGGWIAFLGTVEPRKNLAALVRAYASLRTRRDTAPLVIAGAPGWDDETRRVVESLPDDVDVRLAGYLDAELLPGFLGGSIVMAYPSLGEGFGLPVLEAMACGAPVLTTRELALPEVGGDAVAYTETDAASIAAALDALLDDPARRDELSAAARTRARLFTWDATAAAHVTAYRRARGAA